MKSIMIFFAFVLFKFHLNSQVIDRTIHSTNNLISFSDGKEVNIEKTEDNHFWFLYESTNKWVSIHDAPFNSGNSTSRKSYTIFSVEEFEGCTLFSTIEEGSERLVSFSLCEDSADPYIKMVRYNTFADAKLNGWVKKKEIYYYFD